MLKELKSPQKDSRAWCSQSDRLQMAEDTLSAVRRVRREVVDGMRQLMKLGKERRREGMFALVEDMLRKTKCLCSLVDTQTVEEAFAFLEDNRVRTRPERDEFSESVAEFMQRNRLKIELKLQPPRPRPGAGALHGATGAGASGGASGGAGAGGLMVGAATGTLMGDGKIALQTPCTEFIAKELRTPG